MKNGANINAISIEDKTPLIIAAERAYDTIAGQLIQNGANVNTMHDLLVDLAIDSGLHNKFYTGECSARNRLTHMDSTEFSTLVGCVKITHLFRK